MRHPKSLLVMCLALFAALMQVSHAGDLSPASPSCKIGVYDSRVVALAFYRSAEHMESLKGIQTEYVKAKSENNQERIKELEKEGPWRQVRMHQQVFSTAGILNITSTIQASLKTIAEEAGVIIIVSKWEMPYLAAAVESIDLTWQIAQLFKPDEQTLIIMEAMKTQDPVPFDQLPLDPNL